VISPKYRFLVWLKSAWPHAEVWTESSEVRIPDTSLILDGLAWRRIEGYETLFWLEVGDGHKSRAEITDITTKQLDRAWKCCEQTILPSAVNCSRNSTLFTTLPLCAPTMSPSQSKCGRELISEGPPNVAQRNCAMSRCPYISEKLYFCETTALVRTQMSVGRTYSHPVLRHFNRFYHHVITQNEAMQDK